MGFWSGLGNMAKGAGLGFLTGGPAGAAVGAAGAGLGAMSQGMANNRGGKLSAQMDLARLLLDRDQNYFSNQMDVAKTGFDQSIRAADEGRTSASDAFRKLLASQRVLSPGARPQLAGQYSVAPRQATDMERQGASALSNEVMARLMGGNPVRPSTMPTARQTDLGVDMSLANPGRMERILGYASPALTFLGRNRQGPQTISNDPYGDVMMSLR